MTLIRYARPPHPHRVSSRYASAPAGVKITFSEQDKRGQREVGDVFRGQCARLAGERVFIAQREIERDRMWPARRVRRRDSRIDDPDETAGLHARAGEKTAEWPARGTPPEPRGPRRKNGKPEVRSWTHRFRTG